MAFISLLLLNFIVIYIHSGNARRVFVSVQCKNENIGQYGQKSLLECVVKTSEEVTDPEIRLVTWKKEESEVEVLSFFRGAITHQPGYMFAESSWNTRSMNVSLLITNTTVQDEGVYTCDVVTNSGGGDQYTITRLKVTAKYSVPTIIYKSEDMSQDTGGTLICNSEGGYPGGQLRWFDKDNVEQIKNAKIEAKQEKSGLFHLSSSLTLLGGSISSKYTCVVFNTSGDKGHEYTWTLQDGPTTGGLGQDNGHYLVSRVGAPLVVIGSLIVGLLALLIHRKRFREVRRPSATPFMGHQEVHTGESDAEEDDHQEIEHTDSMA